MSPKVLLHCMFVCSHLSTPAPHYSINDPRYGCVTFNSLYLVDFLLAITFSSVLDALADADATAPIVAVLCVCKRITLFPSSSIREHVCVHQSVTCVFADCLANICSLAWDANVNKYNCTERYLKSRYDCTFT